MTDPLPRTPTGAIPSPAGPRWLSLGPASRVLGVDPDTLRRWADEGRVRAWTTPGGHRRFDRSTLERMARDRRPGAHLRPLADLGATPARLNRVYRQRYAADARSDRAVTEPRDAAERDTYRTEGRRLIAALVAFLDAEVSDEEVRRRLESEAAAVVDGHGRRSAASGVSLTQAVELFVHARQPFLDELSGLGRRRSLDPARLAALYGDASALLDRLLIRFIAAHQAAATAATAPLRTEST